ncbi:MAG: D-alanyl-D-alanine carboxypeptidase family protein, partial [Gammaproteobacteria bacterium]|nr:D-alanyl-D-alanine carboxypeptidase family protein [Gammaproteobacteria bacterium]
MTKLRSTALLSVGVLWFMGLAQAQLPVPGGPEIGARGYVLLDHHSGRILAAKNENERLDPASITKLMTAYVVFRTLQSGQISLDDLVMVSEKAWRTAGSRMFIEVGTRVTVEMLLQGMIVQSGNDASVALAEYVGGSEAIFAQMMNQYAAELGMLNTQYQNSTGLPAKEHFTSAIDIARLATTLIEEFPEFYKWYSQKEFT